ncbi:MAG: uroporphyrinogen-III C-methyltransferase [Gemmatimonadales bacterium]|jgi:uroporphyrinogen III methyltransferase/synthase
MFGTADNPLGTVYLVGAGPGHPGLITMRGIECLRQADVVLYDYLVNPAIVEYAPLSADLVGLGHHKSGRALSPAEITARMLEEARKGRTVVRLKGGDPSVFGRGAEEEEALRTAGIPYEIVPGITAGLAVAAYCEIPITHHEEASAVAIITGRERDEKTESHLGCGLADFPGTLIYYMGVRRVAEWSGALIEQGKSPETPVAIVRWCSRAQQRTIRCTLGTVVNVVEEQDIRPPAVFVVGSVVGRAPEVSWFESRPLISARVLVTGSPGTAEPLRDGLGALGAEVMTRPVIRVTDPPDWAPVDAALKRLGDYDWLVFSSANGVDYLLRRLYDSGADVRRLGRAKLAALGSGTAERLTRYSLRADLVPEQFVAESLVGALVAEARDRRFLIARTDRGRNILAAELEKAGARVDQVVVYGSVDVEEPDPGAVAALSAGEIDWVTVTSSAIARSVVRLYGDALRQARLASIGPLTSATLRELGYEPAVVASPHSTSGLIDAIVTGGPGRD